MTIGFDAKTLKFAHVSKRGLTGLSWATSVTIRVSGKAFLNSVSTLGPATACTMVAMARALVILLGGGTKKRQTRDIRNAQAFWNEYKQETRNASERT